MRASPTAAYGTSRLRSIRRCSRICATRPTATSYRATIKKLQEPRTKLQRSSKIQAPKETSNGPDVLELGSWSFFGAWFLELSQLGAAVIVDVLRRRGNELDQFVLHDGAGVKGARPEGQAVAVGGPFEQLFVSIVHFDL